MREITHTITLPFDVRTVFEWFKNLEKNYIQWHPVAHQHFEWLTEGPVREGTRFSFVERIKKHQHKITARITDYKKDEKFSWASIKIQAHSKYLPDWLLTVFCFLFRVRLNVTHLFEDGPLGGATITTRQQVGSQLAVFGRCVDFMMDALVLNPHDHQSHVAEEWEYMGRELAYRHPPVDEQ
ncbi:MAG: hypothetical protein HKP58_06150 [Desulfatitalea sp.]|nr:hypothetical protein [Desulfatitalea sp.]NNJ99978.1 hypothetical protein [Desulfatitalea sp.]